jgi:hypothetical protein
MVDQPPQWATFTAHELGWIEPSRYVPLAKSVVREQILPPLAKFGVVIPEADVDALLAAPVR